MVEFSNKLSFSNLFLKTPTFYGRLDGRSCSCVLYSENYFKLEHEWVVGNMRYTSDIIVVSIVSLDSFNWYQYWHFLYTHIYFLYVCMLTLQIVSILIGTHFSYTYIFFMYVCLYFIEYQFRLVSNFHTYRCFICAYYISIFFFKHKFWVW